MLAEKLSVATLQSLATALRQIFQADVAVLRAGDIPPLEAVSPRGVETQVWADLVEAPVSGRSGSPSTVIVEVPDDRIATAGVERIVVVPIGCTPSRAALWLGYSKRGIATSEELAVFGLLGDYLALALRQSTADANAAEPSENRPPDDLISQAAHDLRTPLTPISMLLQTLERKAAAGAVDLDSIARARRQVLRLTDMVSDLVDLTRLREGRLLLEPAMMDLREVFSRAAKAFGERDRRRVVELVLGEEPLLVVADTDRTVHAIASLLEHVAKLAPPEAPLTMSLERRNSHVALQIDSEHPAAGGGSSSELASTPFTSQRTPPLGLGVRLADALFARLGGSLQIAAGPDGATRVEGTLPLAPPPTAERPTG
jgi:K+-sensing histidine kinase KdpD